MRSLVALILLLSAACFGQSPEQAILAGARSCVGDVYDARYYAGGPPPKGRGACTDVIYRAFLRVNIDLQDEVYRMTGRDRNIDYRWAPYLNQWFKRHAQSLPRSVWHDNLKSFKPGDVVFWSLLSDGVADHCGIVSDRPDERGRPMVVHNLGPVCTEDGALNRWPIVGHYRLR